MRRSPEAQELLNSYMRRTDVKEFVLALALHAEPATREEVERFLKEKAPPEVFVLLAEMKLDPASPNDPMVALVVSLLLQKRLPLTPPTT